MWSEVKRRWRNRKSIKFFSKTTSNSQFIPCNEWVRILLRYYLRLRRRLVDRTTVTRRCLFTLSLSFEKRVQKCSSRGSKSHARGLRSKRDAHPAGDGAPRVWMALEILQRLFLPEHVLHGYVSATEKKQKASGPDVINTLTAPKEI